MLTYSNKKINVFSLWNSLGIIANPIPMGGVWIMTSPLPYIEGILGGQREAAEAL